MNIPCPIPCQTCSPFVGGASSPSDPDYPFVNLSSEAPDVDSFIGRRFGPPPGSPGGGPPLGNLFYAIGCIGFCVSSVSQEEADLCAQRQELECLSNNWPQFPPGTPDTPTGPFNPGFPPTPLYGNVPKSCDFTCPDGQSFTYTVAAGTFVAFSQAAADAAADSYACQQAIRLRLCIGTLTPTVSCSGVQYSGSISVSSGLPPVSFSIVGDVPDGLVQSQSVNSLTLFFDGVVAVPGDYTFTVVATDRDGHTVSKVCALTFFGITNDSSLPEANEGEAYSVTILTGGTVIESVTFTLSGALPSGLAFNTATGLLSGTPDEGSNGEYDFTITAHADGLSCAKHFFMTVEVPSPVDFTYTGLFGNGDRLDLATINGYDFLGGFPTNGTLLGGEVITTWNVTAGGIGPGYTIAYLLSDTPPAGTYRITVNNLNSVPFTLNPPGVDVQVNGASQWVYNLTTTTGSDFVDVVLNDGDSLDVVFSADGDSAPAGLHSVTITTTKL